MLVVLFTGAVIGLTCYWLGRARRLNEDIRIAQAVQAHPDAPEECLIDMRTGEILYPGTKRYDKALKKSKVRFDV